MRQALGPGALGKPRGSGWRGRWEGGSGWWTHVNPWLFYSNVWQNSLQIKKKSKKKKKERVGVLTHIQCCDVIYNGYDVIIYSGWDLKNSVGVISSVHWMWWHRYSGYDVKYSGCDVIKMVAWCQKAQVWCLYSAKDAIHYPSVMSYGVCVMLSIEWEWWHRLVAVMSHV